MPEYSIAYVKFFINAAARVMNMHTGQTYGMRRGDQFAVTKSTAYLLMGIPIGFFLWNFI